MQQIVVIEGELALEHLICGEIDLQSVIEGEIEKVLYVDTQRQVYPGPYEATPTQQTQTLPTNGFMMEQDITINPIPNNYGLITWNGAVLTVS